MNAKAPFALLVCIFLVSCGPEVTFTEPMPPGEKDVSKIPQRYRGNYVNEDGSAYLHIDKENIVKEYDYDVRIHRDSMTYWDSLSGDTLWDRYNSNYHTVTVDSSGYISYHVNEEETVFALEYGHLARKFKGRLFLNYPLGKNTWTVEQVRLQKGILSISSISSQEEVEALNECVENDSDTVATAYSPTKKQFKSFVKADGFGSSEKYYRIR